MHYRHTDFPGRTNKLARTLAKVQALETTNQPPAASSTEAATLCQPGAKFHSQWDSEYVISFTNSMASDCPFIQVKTRCNCELRSQVSLGECRSTKELPRLNITDHGAAH